MDIRGRNALLRSVFGAEGLTHARDIHQFDYRLRLFNERLNSAGLPKLIEFQQYFTKIETLLRSNLLAGCSRWTSNNIESLNHMFKQTVNWSPQMMPDLIKKLEDLVRGQVTDGHRAIYGIGDYMLRATHERFRTTGELWDRMTEQSRKQLVRRCYVLNPASTHVRSTNGSLTVPSAPGGGKKKNQRKRKRNAKTTTPAKKSRIN